MKFVKESIKGGNMEFNELDKETQFKLAKSHSESSWNFRKYEGPFSAGYIACYEDKLSDVGLLVEFKKRFDKTVLLELEITKILETIGIKKIKEYLKDVK